MFAFLSSARGSVSREWMFLLRMCRVFGGEVNDFCSLSFFVVMGLWDFSLVRSAGGIVWSGRSSFYASGHAVRGSGVGWKGSCEVLSIVRSIGTTMGGFV